MKRILIIEPASVVRASLNEFLTRAGHKVILALNEKETVKALEYYSIDIILIDPVLKNDFLQDKTIWPQNVVDGGVGLVLLNHLNKITPIKAKVIIYTGASFGGIIAAGFPKKEICYLRKPERFSAILKAINGS